MNIKDIAATLAILGSGALVMSGCGKDAPATEVPGEEAAPAADAEASCAADDHPDEGHCGDDAAGGDEAAGEGSCSGEGEEASCSAEAGEEAAE